LFEIGKREGVDTSPRVLPGIASHPAPFGMRLRLRDERYRDMVRSVLDEYPLDSGDAEIVPGTLK
jgi:hypothetical protein